MTSSKQAKHQKIVDAVYLSTSQRIAVATTNRDLCFYETSTSTLLNRLVGLPEIVTSIDFYADPVEPDKATIIYGDMGG